MKTGIIKDARYLNHDMGGYHVETPKRLEAIYRMIQDYPQALVDIPARAATEEEIERIHLPEYYHQVRDTAGKERVILDPDTSTGPKSFETALLAAGGCIRGAEAIMEGEVDSAFALVRPPGHHAEAGQAKGFCIFNNAAVCAEHLLMQYDLKRIMIVDWDLHHGNGTQNSFRNRRDVFYFSTHQFPFYPGSGHWKEIGEGQGRGYTANIPLLPGKTDQDFLYIMRNILHPIVQDYSPDFIIVSAGFDIYFNDPLGGMEVTQAGFAAIARELIQLSEASCNSRLLFVLEGGYHLESLSQGVKEVLLQLGGASPPAIPAEASPALIKELQPAVEILSHFWPLKG